MSRRISLWGLIGLLVACWWVVVGILAGPSYNLGRAPVVAITAPASLLGRRMPLGVTWSILLNGALYAVVGFAIELVRRARRYLTGRRAT
jgi:hypothetical protein